MTVSVGINGNSWSLVLILFGMNFLFKSLHLSSKQQCSNVTKRLQVSFQ